MERIDKKYAIVYIDREGESLKDDVYCFSPDVIHNDFYGQEDADQHIPWNIYLIIPKELVSSKKKIREIEGNDKYCRKYIIPSADIDQFVTNNFPDHKPTKIRKRVAIVTGDCYSDAFSKGWKHPWIAEYDDMLVVDSPLRSLNEFDTLRLLDNYRAKLIKRPNSRIVFISHLTKEISYIQKKMKLFL